MGEKCDEDKDYECDAIFDNADCDTILQYTGQDFVGRCIWVWLRTDSTNQYAEYTL